jgi:DNA-binding protein HU-beta
MNKAQLIDAIAANAGLTKADGKKALDAFIKATTVLPS